MLIQHASSSSGASVSIHSQEITEGHYNICISVNERYYVLVLKGDIAIEAFRNWYEIDFCGDKSKINENINKLQNLVDSNLGIELIDDQKEAYRQCLDIRQHNNSSIYPGLFSSKHPPKPDKDFTMLKDWYFDVLDIDKTEFLKTSIDHSPETLNTFEIETIERLIKSITRNYFPTEDIEKKSRLLNSKEVTANRTFLKWLHERKEELERIKIYTVEEESHIADIKNWNKRMRTYLLIQIGISSLNLFKGLGQKNKYDLIANILNCSPRKAMEYYNHCEKTLKTEEKEEVKEYLSKLQKK